MEKKQSKKESAMKKTEAFVREALAQVSKKQPSETIVRAVAKKIAKALPEHEAAN